MFYGRLSRKTAKIPAGAGHVASDLLRERMMERIARSKAAAMR
jgi:hypothetical protein